jgi:hypothetical protein
MSHLEKPDLREGVPLASIPEGGKLLGVVDMKRYYWSDTGGNCLH